MKGRKNLARGKQAEGGGEDQVDPSRDEKQRSPLQNILLVLQNVV